MDETISSRFLTTVQESYRRYVEHGSRSNEKIKVLHGWVISELQSLLGREYYIQGYSDDGGREVNVEGQYYNKNVDVSISRDNITLGVVSIKFVMSNYRQNKHNYFEHQLGETANLRSSDLVFGHIMILCHPTPYLKRAGDVKRYEEINDSMIKLYAGLVQDHGHAHVPDAQCLAIFLLDKHKGEIVRQCDAEDMKEVSSEYYSLLEDRLNVERFFNVMHTAIDARYIKLKPLGLS